jgi:hypothetical protein
VEEEESVRNFSLLSQFSRLIIVVFGQDLSIHALVDVIPGISLIAQPQQSLDCAENVDSDVLGKGVLGERVQKLNNIVGEDQVR